MTIPYLSAVHQCYESKHPTEYATEYGQTLVVVRFCGDVAVHQGHTGLGYHLGGGKGGLRGK